MYTSGASGYETTFELNEFNEPKIQSEMEAVKNVILFILFSKPGSYPSLPMIGMDIEDRLYEFYDDIDEEELQNELIEQCSALNTYISSGSIIIRKLIYDDQPSLIIHIEGIETWPPSYKHDNVQTNTQFNIGITYDQLRTMLVNVQ